MDMVSDRIGVCALSFGLKSKFPPYFLLCVGILMVAGFASLFGKYWQWALGGLVTLTFVCIALYLVYKDK